MSTTFNAMWAPLFKASMQENGAKTFIINWEGELDAVTVSASVWTTEDQLTIANTSNTTTTTTARFSAVTPGTYRAVNKVTLSDGDTQERLIDVQIRDNSQIPLTSIWGTI